MAKILHTKRGLPVQVKKALEPLLLGHKWRMTKALNLLNKAGLLKSRMTPHVRRTVKARVRGYLQRKRLKTRNDFWAHTYGSFETIVSGRHLSDTELERWVREGESEPDSEGKKTDYWNKPFVFDRDISSEKKTNYFASATIRWLANAGKQMLLGVPS